MLGLVQPADEVQFFQTGIIPSSSGVEGRYAHFMQTLHQAVHAAIESFEVVALRADDRIFSIGELLPVSREWSDDELTGQTLDGTCGLRVQSLEELDGVIALLSGYHYSHIYVIVSNCNYSEGTDPGEVVITKARCFARVSENNSTDALKVCHCAPISTSTGVEFRK